MVRASTSGPTVEFTSARGLKTRCMAMDNSSGQTANNTKEISRMTRSMVREPSSGPMAEFTQASGSMESKMAQVFTLLNKMECQAWVFGKKENT